MSDLPNFSMFIPGRPVPAPRPRVTRRGTYYSEEYTAWVDLVRVSSRSLWQSTPTKQPVSLAIIVRVPDRRHGDLSNYVKAVEDALQGVVFENDKQVTSINADMMHDPDMPGVSITVMPGINQV